ncbi:TPA: hypothetical protein N0F65_011884 [Lagenidium giganteum]|uniref:ABM domain-containing protein n=1 Tax=Lagenidium giganteum TaxID=4803 RepID=A0AAV2YJA8_9STRA|nr:TPA: hypothetical protein N0F65_011884 [Lagenidium giganteum]
MSGRIRVISERIMTRGYEPAVARLMEHVKSTVSKQPGLIAVDTYSQVDDQHKYVVFSEWKSKKHYDQWVSSPEFKDCTRKINELLDVPGMQTRMFKEPSDDIFLL